MESALTGEVLHINVCQSAMVEITDEHKMAGRFEQVTADFYQSL
jgi:hypothetical protein